MIGSFVKNQKPLEDINNSKILNRKQIQKRLQGLSTEEYQKISINLRSQNQKLKQEVKILNQKVQQLLQSRKISKNVNPQIEQQIARHKKQLQLKYESMKYLKQQIKKGNQSQLTQQMKMKIKQRINDAMKCQKQLKQLNIQKQRIKIQIVRNQQSMKQFVNDDDEDARIQQYKQQNKLIKKKINSIKQKLNQQQKTSKQTIDKIYTLKDQQKTLNRSSRSISSSLRQIRSQSISQINELQKQIQNLKNKKNQVQKDLVTQKIIKQSKKGKLQKQIKTLLEYHKQLFKRRVKSVNQLNLYQKKQQQLKQAINKIAEKQKITLQTKQIQTQSLVKKKLRKQWIGKSQGLQFNDSNIIITEQKQFIYIQAVTVYKTQQSIVFVKFHYQTSIKKKFQSQPPFQKFILKKCQNKKYQSKTHAYLTNIIVSSHTQSKKIVRIQFKWKDGDTTIIGWQIQGSTKYVFDIGGSQRPVCMFGSVYPTGRYSFVLQTLGCQIEQDSQ